jgi:hypothetical protein
MAFEIKEEFLNEVVAFGDSCDPLGKRTDLHLLAETAIHPDGRIKDKHIIGYFKEVPTLDEIKAAKEKSFQQKQSNKPLPAGSAAVK